MSRLRRTRAGFTLLETMVALAIAAICVGMTLSFAIRLTATQKDAVYRLTLQEYAHSILDAYRVIGPAMGDRGESPGGWSWSISVKPDPDKSGQLKAMGLAQLQVTVEVLNRDHPDVTISETQVMARRYQDVFP